MPEIPAALPWILLVVAGSIDAVLQVIITRRTNFPERYRLPLWMYDSNRSFYRWGGGPPLFHLDDAFHQVQGWWWLITATACFAAGDARWEVVEIVGGLALYWLAVRDVVFHAVLPRPGWRQIPIVRFSKALRDIRW